MVSCKHQMRRVHQLTALVRVANAGDAEKLWMGHEALEMVLEDIAAADQTDTDRHVGDKLH